MFDSLINASKNMFSVKLEKIMNDLFKPILRFISTFHSHFKI